MTAADTPPNGALTAASITVPIHHHPSASITARDADQSPSLENESGYYVPINTHLPPIIQLKNIHKTYLLGLEGVPALRGVSLNVYPGEWLIIYGNSGGGKSTLLNVLGTIDKPTKGELHIGGSPITSDTSDEDLATIRLQKLGFVFQSFNLITSMTASENVELPMTLKGDVPRNKRRQLVHESLQRVGLGHRLDHFPTQLSGGEAQRVTIARAIANTPDVLLLDEPTGDLDTANTHRIIDLLCRLNSENGMTMIMVTHDVYLKSFAHRVVYMRDGKVAREERIPAAVRNRALDELNHKLVALGLAKPKVAAAAAPLASSPLPAVSMPAPVPAVVNRTSSKTHLRKPSDYGTSSAKAIEMALAFRAQFAQPPESAKKEGDQEEASRKKKKGGFGLSQLAVKASARVQGVL